MRDLARTFRTIRHLRFSQLYWRLRYRRENSRPIVMSPAPAKLAARKDFPQALLTVSEEPPSGATGILLSGATGVSLSGATGVSPVPPADEHWQNASGTQLETPLTAEQLIDQLERGCFEHLNESRELDNESIDWLLGPRDEGRLWAITLHYHRWAWRLAQVVKASLREGATGCLSASAATDLGSRADRLLRRYLGDWITRCDPTVEGSRALAWNAYAVATRIGSWCRLYHRLGPEGRATWGTLESVFLESLWSQAAFLSNHLEKDLRANHLLRDAVGLAWAGRFFEGPRPKRWLRTATELAVEQAREQVLADGGHFERSPMYHVEVMDDFLTLGVLLEDEAARRAMKKTWLAMAEFMAWARHPDGQVPLLNDGGLNGTCSPAAMFAEGRRLLDADVDASPRRGGRLFPDFGLAVWQGEPWSLYFDVGPVGVDCQPGHAHADTLTFEASYEGQRLFVDPGTLRYDHDESRRYDRATASHNTITIDDIDSSEVWHIFRVGRRAQPLGVKFEADAQRMKSTAAHTGYDHLQGRPRHQREIEVDNAGRLTITDRLQGHGRHQISGGLLIAPGWQIEPFSGGWRLSQGDKVLHLTLDAAEAVETELQTAAYHPEYGLEQSSERIVWRGVLELPYILAIHIEPVIQ